MASNSDGHNQIVRKVFPLIIDGRSEEECWVVIESLCAGVGALFGRDGRQTATFVETVAERLATGERPMPRIKG